MMQGKTMDKSRIKILIIEDEANIRELVKYNLESEGYDVIEGEDGIKGMALVYTEKPDLILLDIMLPGKNGYEICFELRSEGITVPIIMVTAKSEEIDKVKGLEFGADDYISKPFGIGELMARVKAVLRRYRINGEDRNELHREKLLTIGSLTVYPDRFEAFIDGKPVSLTVKEFELLVFLASNPGIVFSRDELLDKVWGIDYMGESRTVDVHIRHLRMKLEPVNIIETVRRKGYKIKGG